MGSHFCVHLFECRFGLFPEAFYNLPGELVRIFLVHFEDLLECAHVDIVAEVEVVLPGVSNVSFLARYPAMCHNRLVTDI